MSPSRQTLRKVVAPIALILGILVLGSQFLGSDRRKVTLEFSFGAESDKVDHLRIELFRHEEPELLGYLERRFDAGSATVKWPIEANEGRYRVVAIIRTKTGQTLRSERPLSVEDFKRVRFDLSRELEAQ